MKNTYFKVMLSVFVTGCILTSCYKEFNPKSYAPPFTISGFSSVKQIKSANLVGYWAFEGSYIDSVSKTVGTGVGTTFVNGFKGKAMQGALNAYALSDASSEISNLKSFTISEWVNTPPPSTGIIGIFSLVKTDAFWGNLEIFFENGSSNTNGKFRLHAFDGVGDRTYSVDNLVNLFNAWVNITVSYDAASATYNLYVNGALANTGKAPGLTGDLNFSSVGKIVFGCVQFQTTPSQTSATGSQPWASFLTGNLDEVRVYNAVLTPTEVNALVILQGKGK